MEIICGLCLSEKNKYSHSFLRYSWMHVVSNPTFLTIRDSVFWTNVMNRRSWNLHLALVVYWYAFSIKGNITFLPHYYIIHFFNSPICSQFPFSLLYLQTEFEYHFFSGPTDIWQWLQCFFYFPLQLFVPSKTGSVTDAIANCKLNSYNITNELYNWCMRMLSPILYIATLFTGSLDKHKQLNAVHKILCTLK